MCGIYICLHPTDRPPPPLDPLLLSLLQARGPEICRQGSIELGNGLTLSYCCTVLWLQGEEPHPQPVTDVVGNLLMWNGDVYNREDLGGENKNECDTTLLAARLSEAVTEKEVLEVFGLVKGPWAFVYLHKATNSLWFGRDCFGRSSLLMRKLGEELILTSVSSVHLKGISEVNTMILERIFINECPFQVPAQGIFQLALPSQQLTLHPWKKSSCIAHENYLAGQQISSTLNTLDSFSEVWEPLEDLLTEEEVFSQLLQRSRVKAAVGKLLELLRRSIERRVVCHQPQRCKACVVTGMAKESCSHPTVSVLLSGGVDSSLLALLVAQALPDRPIPLVNVAFQQGNGSYEVPDRLTGKEAVLELNQLLPGRCFELTCVDVSKEELVKSRLETIQHLLHPLATVLDDSIGCAIWFAAREAGRSARVVVLGMGIDEQLGGYSRHRTAFSKGGPEALAAELRMDLERISERNLGRDDRIVSDHGISARYPFLDEDFVNFLTSLELSLKCDFRLGRGLGEKLVLRLAAHSLGLKGAARQQKRAVQFGSRIAKMENKKEKAHQKAVR